MTECWLMPSYLVPLLDSYSSVVTMRNLSQNVTVYYKEKFNVVPNKPVLCEANCLFLVININTVIIAIYRPPAPILSFIRGTSEFFKSLDQLLINLIKINKISFVLYPAHFSPLSAEFWRLDTFTFLL